MVFTKLYLLYYSSGTYWFALVFSYDCMKELCDLYNSETKKLSSQVWYTRVFGCNMIPITWRLYILSHSIQWCDVVCYGPHLSHAWRAQKGLPRAPFFQLSVIRGLHVSIVCSEICYFINLTDEILFCAADHFLPSCHNLHLKLNMRWIYEDKIIWHYLAITKETSHTRTRAVTSPS